mmetsp:Transcript_16569/g.32954  ORF Transcript_16569/g.32954 Transcript_16569/m.32954 type:complete len:382 (-) Transcript_16569:92-1237(-)
MFPVVSKSALLIATTSVCIAMRVTSFSTGANLPTRDFAAGRTLTFLSLDAAEETPAPTPEVYGGGRLDVGNLLTQRAIQSFMFLQTELRDPHSGKWIDDFLGMTGGLANFHGTGALGGSWDAVLLAMAEQPKDVVVVSAKRRGRGHGGWSKDNPYLPERWVEFDIDIDPVSITARILSVREQIAREWVVDLGVLVDSNAGILDSYYEILKESGGDEPGLRTVAFRRDAGDMLLNRTNSAVVSSSPLRHGNFDLLHLLATQAATHRILEDLMGKGEVAKVPFRWLREFYTKRAAEYFDGDQIFGRADDFLEELMLKSPSSVYTGFQKAGLADPMGLAATIIKERKDVLVEWQKVMLDTPSIHSDMRKALLSKQMEAWGSGGS